MKFVEVVVVQGLEERFVDRNGMVLFGVMTPRLGLTILKMTNLVNTE